MRLFKILMLFIAVLLIMTCGRLRSVISPVVENFNFGGVYMNSDVYVNGEHAGFQQYGYVPFSYDITSLVRFDTTNIIAVRVDNSQLPTDRWYSGSGIYSKSAAACNASCAYSALGGDHYHT